MKLRFTIRDLFWLVLVVALAVAWWLDHAKWKAAYDEAANDAARNGKTAEAAKADKYRLEVMLQQSVEALQQPRKPSAFKLPHSSPDPDEDPAELTFGKGEKIPNVRPAN